ncbi:RadC family protein [Ferrimonas lipolytica]|uniref:DNA repair protein RadC n=1 Tax=Ferrimonas lipolytica TaxID=2724191 RepID=A0A6H1UKL1_9GAMM|nr:DNA repair protein RadC [Ferrimonas lipolytica]QIZ78342.1 DNA repair protein RadC [Ferrimonas lipolytica]
MPISQWPQQERPRERLLQQGATALSDAELLAIFLRTGVAGCSAVQLARNLLQQFGGLAQLLSASEQEFCSYRGLGQAKYVQLQATLELARRYLACEVARSSVLSSPQTVRDYLQIQLQGLEQERFLLLLLDSQHRVIELNTLSIGTINAATVHPREVVKTTLAANAAAVILAHNHPSGVCEPSNADRQITGRIQQALALIDVPVLDHLVVGSGQSCSFAERGWL